MRPELAALPVCFSMAVPSPPSSAQDSSLTSAQTCPWPDPRGTLYTWQQEEVGGGGLSRIQVVCSLMSQQKLGPLGRPQPDPKPC